MLNTVLGAFEVGVFFSSARGLRDLVPWTIAFE